MVLWIFVLLLQLAIVIRLTVDFFALGNVRKKIAIF